MAVNSKNSENHLLYTINVELPWKWEFKFSRKENKNIIEGFAGKNIHLQKEQTNDAINPPGNLANKQFCWWDELRILMQDYK